MARITIADENRQLDDVDEIRSFLKPFGIWFENWDVEGRITEDATSEDVLQAYAPEINRLKESGGYVTADVISVNPETPNLKELLEKFSKEHTHTEDEVRFTIKGAGIFHINPDNGPVFAVQVESGDMINVPAGVRHWFDLCSDHTIRCIRLFLDPEGWTPHYVDDGIQGNYEPVCWGPNYVQAEGDAGDSVVKL